MSFYGYLMLIRIDLYDFNSPFSSDLVLIENTYFQTPGSWEKYVAVFRIPTLLTVFDNVIQHGLSFLI